MAQSGSCLETTTSVTAIAATPTRSEIGNRNLTAAESRAVFSLWCAVKAPLILGNDVTDMSADTLAILTNGEAIAVSQDPLGEQARLVRGGASAPAAEGDGPAPQCGQVWAGALSDGALVALLLNTDAASARDLTLEWVDLPGVAPSARLAARDLWRHEDLGTFVGDATFAVEPHGVAFVKLTAAPASR